MVGAGLVPGWRRPPAGFVLGALLALCLHDWLALVASMIRDSALRRKPQRIRHPQALANLDRRRLLTVNVDSLLVSVGRRADDGTSVARRATSGASKFRRSSRWRSAIDTQVKDVFHGNRSYVAPVA